MSRIIGAEMRKVLATPTAWWLLLGTAAIGVLGTLVPLLAAPSGADLLTDVKLQEAMHGAAAGVILVLVAGIIGMAGEWRFGQASQTFLTTPHRRRVVLAKTWTYAALGIVYGVVAATACLITAWTWYRGEGLALPLDRSAVWLTLLGCLVVAVGFGVLGVALGAIARNQVVAIVAAMAWLLVVEQALFTASPTVFRWLPGMASFSVRRQPNDGLLAFWPALAVLAITVVVALVVGAIRVERADVTTET